jgi:hypothetical protein
MPGNGWSSHRRLLLNSKNGMLYERQVLMSRKYLKIKGKMEPKGFLGLTTTWKMAQFSKRC